MMMQITDKGDNFFGIAFADENGERAWESLTTKDKDDALSMLSLAYRYISDNKDNSNPPTLEEQYLKFGKTWK